MAMQTRSETDKKASPRPSSSSFFSYYYLPTFYWLPRHSWLVFLFLFSCCCLLLSSIDSSFFLLCRVRSCNSTKRENIQLLPLPYSSLFFNATTSSTSRHLSRYNIHVVTQDTVAVARACTLCPASLLSLYLSILTYMTDALEANALTT